MRTIRNFQEDRNYAWPSRSRRTNIPGVQEQKRRERCERETFPTSSGRVHFYLWHVASQSSLYFNQLRRNFFRCDGGQRVIGSGDWSKNLASWAMANIPLRESVNLILSTAMRKPGKNKFPLFQISSLCPVWHSLCRIARGLWWWAINSSQHFYHRYS